MENSLHISSSKIQALIRLLEDPDPNIHNVVKAKLVSYGKTVLPHIEQSWYTDITDQDHQTQVQPHIFYRHTVFAQKIGGCPVHQAKKR